MTFDEYKQIIDQWTNKVNNAGVRLSNGKLVPFTFWKTFLGVSRKTHQEIYNGNYKVRGGKVPAYLVRTLHLASLLDDVAFLNEACACLPAFEADKVS